MSENPKQGMFDASGMGMTSDVHSTFQSSDYDRMIQGALIRKSNPVIVDMGASGGRDSIMMHDFALQAQLNPLSIAIDSNPNKFHDARRDYEGRFTQVSNFNDVARAHCNGKISYLIEEIPYQTTGLIRQMTDSRLPKTKVDFMLCNAVVMFIPRRDLPKSLKIMADMLSPEREGQMLLGFSTGRPEQYMAKSDQCYSKDEIDDALTSLRGVTVKRLPDLDDVLQCGRGFPWHYRLVTRKHA
jgi:hypothetical protein